MPLTQLQQSALKKLYRSYGDPVDGERRRKTFDSLVRRKLAVEVDKDLYRISLRGLLVVRGVLG